MTKPAQPKQDTKKSTDQNLKSLSELAQVTGISAGKIGQAVKEGFVAKTAAGQYQLGPALLGLIRFLDSKASTLPTYDSVSQCAAATGIPASSIKQARRLTKEPFRGTRISLGPLLRAIFEQRGAEDWKALHEQWSAMREKIALDNDLKLRLDKAEVGHAIARGISSIFSELDQQTEVELPPMLKGCDEETIRNRLREAREKLRSSLAAEWSKLMHNGNAKREQRA